MFQSNSAATIPLYRQIIFCIRLYPHYMTHIEGGHTRKKILARANMSLWTSVPVNSEEWLYALRAQIRVSLQEILSIKRRVKGDSKRPRKHVGLSKKTKDMVLQLRTMDQVLVWELEESFSPSDSELEAVSKYMPVKFPLLLRGSKILKKLNGCFRERKEREKLAAVESQMLCLIQEAPVQITSKVPTENFALKELFLRKAYYFWKRVPRALFSSIQEPVRLGFFRCTMSVLCQIVRLWTSHRRTLGHVLRPPWVVLYELRALGSVLCANQPVEGLDWVTKQLGLCNELIKESKKSFADYAKNRFMIPQFHLSMYEPMEVVRSSMEQKLGKKIKLFFAPHHSRHLESIGTVNPSTDHILAREFPKSQPLAEPPDSEHLSEQFKKRRTPKDLPQAVGDLQNFLKYFRKLLKQAKARHGLGSGGAKHGPTGPMSSTKFLSSNFGTLNIAEDEDKTLSGDAVDQGIDFRPGDSFFDKYFYRPPVEPQTPSPIPILPIPPKPNTMPYVPPPMPILPGIAPPSSVIKPPSPPTSARNQIGIWGGMLEGPPVKGGGKEFRLDIALIPFFRSPRAGTSEFESLEQILRTIPCFQYEGSLGAVKFAEHYGKLMAPAHRKRREPFSFIVARKGGEEETPFLDKIAPNSATAFAAFLPPYKLKLWIVRVEDDYASAQLPIVPGFVFGFMEIPPNVFAPNLLTNILIPPDIANVASKLKQEQPSIIGTGAIPIRTMEALPTQQTTPPPMSAQQEALARVFELINQTNKSPPPGTNKRSFEESSSPPIYDAKPLETYIPPQPAAASRPLSAFQETLQEIHAMPSAPPPRNHPLASATPYQAPQPSRWSTNLSTQNIVIGAPSVGPSVDQMPNPKRGACKFFNLNVGCQSGPKCRFAHFCSVCGAEDHPAYMHHNI